MDKLTCFSIGNVGRPFLKSGYSRSLHALKRVKDIPTLGFEVFTTLQGLRLPHRSIKAIEIKQLSFLYLFYI